MKRLLITEAHKKTLRNIAARNGLLIGRGPMAQSGSMDALIRAIAEGRAVVLVLAGPEIEPETLTVELAEAAKLRGEL